MRPTRLRIRRASALDHLCLLRTAAVAAAIAIGPPIAGRGIRDKGNRFARHDHEHQS
jgi:hypothetical protein